MNANQVMERIAARKAELGDKLVILGHHYQRDDIVRFVDVLGDSFHLAREAAKLTQAQYIIFCGVYFMAESADVLTGDHQKVILPDLEAGCPMADMAKLEDVQTAWKVIHEVCADVELLPITYINSSAAIKAFVGEHGGTVCTSSNCEKILAWALKQKSKVLFFPDQHLARNTAYKMGWPLESMVVWDYTQPRGGLSDEAIRKATFILWKGCCSVHQVFRPEHVDAARAGGARVIVHPECCFDVVQRADLSGSTDLIGKTVAASPAGSKWAIGTEMHMVQRLAKAHPDKQITMLGGDGCPCKCDTMYRIDPPHLLWVLDNLAEGRVVNQVAVDEKTKHWARVSLQRMLDITK